MFVYFMVRSYKSGGKIKTPEVAYVLLELLLRGLVGKSGSLGVSHTPFVSTKGIMLKKKVSIIKEDVCIGSPVGVEQVLEEVVEAVLPGQPERAAREEGRHGVAQHVVQPALRPQLPHGRVHEREPRPALHPPDTQHLHYYPTHTLSHYHLFIMSLAVQQPSRITPQGKSSLSHSLGVSSAIYQYRHNWSSGTRDYLWAQGALHQLL